MGRNVPKKNRNDETAAEQHMIDGLNKHAATIPAIVIGGASFTTKDIAGTLQARIDTAKAAASTRATWQAAVQADRDERKKTKTFVSAVRQALLVAFVGQVDALADFGLTPRKAHVVTPGVHVAAAAKAKATRAARHTMGKKQKAEIKGTVAPTAPAGTASPAPTPNLPPQTAPTTTPNPVTPPTPTRGT